MSRIGRSPIPVPSGVTIEVTDRHVKVTGPKGMLERDLPREAADWFPSVKAPPMREDPIPTLRRPSGMSGWRWRPVACGWTAVVPRDQAPGGEFPL